jgi:hypothetical protein
MIRIDEIYNNMFWPWINKNKPGSRLFFCDPPGRTDPDALFNLGQDDVIETDYVFFHDQEPIHLEEFEPLFHEVVRRNLDLYNDLLPLSSCTWPNNKLEDYRTFRLSNPASKYFDQHPEIFCQFRKLNHKKFNIGHVIVSERGDYVNQLEQEYGWKSHYYFYHGWACQDWYRGYDKSFLIPRAKDRTPAQTFMSPNRIVAGKRDHRVLFLYNVFKNQLEHNHISAPRICQYENIDISTIAKKYCNVYSDIEQVLNQAKLPRLFAGEESQQMTSCWLSNFNEAADSLVYVPTETVYFGSRTHITEKTFKAIALEMPFVLVAPAGSLSYMREYGFQTFADIFDESYDLETDDILRIEKVVKLLKDLDALTVKERQRIHQACLPAVEHNYHHFYRGGLTDVLWPELINMLNGLKS